MSQPTGSKTIYVLILVIVASVTLRALVQVIAPLLPWIAIGLLSSFGIAIGVRIYLTRSKHL